MPRFSKSFTPSIPDCAAAGKVYCFVFIIFNVGKDMDISSKLIFLAHSV